MRFDTFYEICARYAIFIGLYKQQSTDLLPAFHIVQHVRKDRNKTSSIMSPLIKILFGCGLCLAGIQAMSTHQRASERAYSQPQVSNHPAKYNFQYAVKDDQR